MLQNCRKPERAFNACLFDKLVRPRPYPVGGSLALKWPGRSSRRRCRERPKASRSTRSGGRSMAQCNDDPAPFAGPLLVEPDLVCPHLPSPALARPGDAAASLRLPSEGGDQRAREKSCRLSRVAGRFASAPSSLLLLVDTAEGTWPNQRARPSSRGYGMRSRSVSSLTSLTIRPAQHL